MRSMCGIFFRILNQVVWPQSDTQTSKWVDSSAPSGETPPLIKIGTGFDYIFSSSSSDTQQNLMKNSDYVDLIYVYNRWKFHKIWLDSFREIGPEIHEFLPRSDFGRTSDVRECGRSEVFGGGMPLMGGKHDTKLLECLGHEHLV